MCPFGCRLPQQQSTFRLADPSFPVTRMAFPLFDVSTPAGTRLRRREERKKNVRESGEAGKGRHCSTMAQLFFVVERGGRKKKKKKVSRVRCWNYSPRRWSHETSRFGTDVFTASLDLRISLEGTEFNLTRECFS